MANISIIAAIGKNNELGLNNQLIWHLPNDLKFFKEQTINHQIIMGKNTLDSLPKLLPGRKHLVLTHQKLEETDQLQVFHTKDDLINYLNNIDEEVFVIGGAKVYNEFFPFATKLVLTEIEASSEADAYFPKFNKEEWNRKVVATNCDNDIKYNHVIYTKKEIK